METPAFVLGRIGNTWAKGVLKEAGFWLRVTPFISDPPSVLTKSFLIFLGKNTYVIVPLASEFREGS